MKFILITSIFIMCFTVKATTDCIYVVGGGSFFSPQVEVRHLDGIKAAMTSWKKDCANVKVLVSFGKKSMIYDYDNNQYTPISGINITGSATTQNILDELQNSFTRLKKGDEVRLYFQDHGNHEGFGTADGLMEPEKLESKLATMNKYGIKFKAVFASCYSGNLNEALYNSHTGKVYGCSLTSANDNISFSSPRISGEEKNNSFFNIVNDNHIDSHDNSLRNIYMTTSQGFLFNYAKNKLSDNASQCYYGNLFNLTGTSWDFVHAYAQQDIAKYYEKVSAGYKHLEHNEKIGLENYGLTGKSLKDYATRDTISKCKDNIYKSMNEEIKKIVQRQEKAKKAYNEFHTLYDKLLKCSETKKAIFECEGHTRFLELQKYVNTVEKYYKDNSNLSTVPKNCFIETAQDLTLSEALNELHEADSNILLLKAQQTKKDIYAKKMYALLYMMKHNDTQAIQTLREMIECERSSSIFSFF